MLAAATVQTKWKILTIRTITEKAAAAMNIQYNYLERSKSKLWFIIQYERLLATMTLYSVRSHLINSNDMSLWHGPNTGYSDNRWHSHRAEVISMHKRTKNRIHCCHVELSSWSSLAHSCFLCYVTVYSLAVARVMCSVTREKITIWCQFVRHWT